MLTETIDPVLAEGDMESIHFPLDMASLKDDSELDHPILNDDCDDVEEEQPFEDDPSRRDWILNPFDRDPRRPLRHGAWQFERWRPAQVPYAEGMFALDGGRSLYSRDAAAFHEAGHAVIGYALGLGCGGILIRSGSSLIPEDGRVMSRQGRTTDDDHAGAVARAIATFAGPAAEYKFCRVSDDPWNEQGVNTFESGAGDRRDIDRLLADTGWTKEMVWREAQDALDVPLIWDAVEKLAFLLEDGLTDPEGYELEEFWLDGDKAEAFIHDAHKMRLDHRTQTFCEADQPIYAFGVRPGMLAGWRYRTQEMPRLVRYYWAMRERIEEIRTEREARPS